MPGLHPPAAPARPSAPGSTAPHPPSQPHPHPPATPVRPASHPSAAGSAPSVLSRPPGQQQLPVSSQDPLVAGLVLVPDSPRPCSGMPPLEELPSGVRAPSPAGVLDPQGFLTNHRPPQPDVFIPNPNFPSSGPSAQNLTHRSVGSGNLNVINTSMSNVASQKSSDVGSQKCSNVGSQNNSNVESTELQCRESKELQCREPKELH